MESFPNEEIDEEILIAAVELISQAVPRNKTNQVYILSKDGLRKIVVQLQVTLDEMQKEEELSKEYMALQVRIFEKITLALTNLVFESPTA